MLTTDTTAVKTNPVAVSPDTTPQAPSQYDALGQFVGTSSEQVNGGTLYKGTDKTGNPYQRFAPGTSGTTQAGAISQPVSSQLAATTPTTQPNTSGQANAQVQQNNAPTANSTPNTSTQAQPNSTDYTSKLTSSLNKGLFNPQDIAADTGLTLDEVNSAMQSDYNLSHMAQENKINTDLDTGYQDYKTKMDSIMNGTFELTTDEQAQVQAVKDMFDRMREEQLMANRNYEGTVSTAEMRSGRSEFMSQISGGIYKQAVDSGLQKIKDLEVQAAAKVSELKNLFKENRYKDVERTYNALDKYLTQKKEAINEIHSATRQLYEDIDAKNKEDLATKKLADSGFKDAVASYGGLYDTKTGKFDDTKVAQVATYWKLDPNIVKGQVAEYFGKQATPEIKADTAFEDKMLQTGYRTINPADINRMREAGNTVITRNGRAYMKEAPTKIITIGSGKSSYKAVVDTKGNVIKKIGGGGTTSIARTTSGGSPTSASGISKKDKQAILSAVNSGVEANIKAGAKDRFLSPDDYASAKADWLNKGGSATQFDSTMKGYRNPQNKNYQVGK